MKLERSRKQVYEKKIKKHFTSQSHELCRKQFLERNDEVIQTYVNDCNDKKLASTYHVLNTVYYMAKIVDLLLTLKGCSNYNVKMNWNWETACTPELVPLTLSVISHDTHKNRFFPKLQKKDEICVIVDEASTISGKSVLITFVKCDNSAFAPSIFLNLVRLVNQKAKTILQELLRCLDDVGFSN